MIGFNPDGSIKLPSDVAEKNNEKLIFNEAFEKSLKKATGVNTKILFIIDDIPNQGTNLYSNEEVYDKDSLIYQLFDAFDIAQDLKDKSKAFDVFKKNFFVMYTGKINRKADYVNNQLVEIKTILNELGPEKIVMIGKNLHDNIYNLFQEDTRFVDEMILFDSSFTKKIKEVCNSK